MTLDTLIQELEKADGLATGGDMDCAPPREGFDDDPVWLSIDKIWALGPNDAEGIGHEDAQAIAIRHNTAALVISELKAQRARADRAEARVTELEADIVQHVNGANALRHFNAGPQVNPITSEVQDGRWVNAIMKSRWDGEAWDAVGMVNGWIGSFEGELPDCVADKCRGIDYGHIPEPTPEDPTP